MVLRFTFASIDTKMFFVVNIAVRLSLMFLVFNAICASSDLVTGPEDAFIGYYSKDCDTATRDTKTVDPNKLLIHWFNSRTQNETTFGILEANEVLYQSPNFKATDKLYFYVPDFALSPRTWDSVHLSESFLKLKNTHLLIIDSSEYTGYNNIDIEASLKRAFANCYIIGKYIGEFLHNATLDGLELSDIHLFGLGLGAPISGHAARRFSKVSGKKLNRVSGLDPSGGCFNKAKIEDVLSKADATYVDTYHTNIGQFGTNNFLGHAAFFPNGGGPRQSDCIPLPLLSSGCSHVNVPITMWANSALNPSKFKARNCDSWEVFKSGLCEGEIVQAGVQSDLHKGHYYLKTKTPALRQLPGKVGFDLVDIVFNQLLGG